jgi:hypothetical protein
MAWRCVIAISRPFGFVKALSDAPYEPLICLAGDLDVPSQDVLTGFNLIGILPANYIEGYRYYRRERQGRALNR